MEDNYSWPNILGKKKAIYLDGFEFASLIIQNCSIIGLAVILVFTKTKYPESSF